MTSPAPPANRDYTVGWICALPIEMAAAKGMLDENYGKPNEQDDSDKNNYWLGRIWKHNVVIACLPNGVYGITSAAIVASQMLCSFTSVKIGLMVGIGGGVPSKEHDIRLGDVVVSKPGQKFGGVVQYDFGKALAGGEFIQAGSLNKPPHVLLTATANLETDHEMEESKIPQFLSHMVERYPRMRTEYSYQGAEHDLLYRAGYDHIGSNSTCEHCDISNKEERSIRDDNCPVIHYGTIASGNQVMKHGATRDRLREKLDVLCFEMEAAGLMDNFPCLVVRGICDYADSHKNKRWQKYAAATAAAYAKELLEVIPAAGVEKTPKIVDVLSGIDNKLASIIKDQHDQRNHALLDWLSPLEPSKRHQDVRSMRLEGTCQWMLRLPEFLDWSSDTPSSRALCCFGDPGTGKTVMASLVIDELSEQLKKLNDVKIGLAYVYCDYRDQQEQTTTNLVGAMLKQLLATLPAVPQEITTMYEQKHQQNRQSLEPSDAIAFFRSTCGAFDRVYICLDALDECKDMEALLNNLQNMPSSVCIFATGRKHIQKVVQQHFQQALSISVQANESDIRAFVKSRIDENRIKLEDIMDERLEKEILEKIIASSKGMFLLPALQIRIVLDERTKRKRRLALDKLPSDLGNAFMSTIERIKEQPKGSSDQAMQVLTWIHLAERPLTVDELLHALATEIGDLELSDDNFPSRDNFLDYCLGLVIRDDETSTVRLVHFSLQEYLTQNKLFRRGHEYIAQICLTYLMFESTKRESASKEVTNKTEAEAQEMAFQTGLALFDYAACQWGHHVRKSYGLKKCTVKLILSYLSNDSWKRISSVSCLCKNMREDFSVLDHGPFIESFSSLHIAAYFGIHQALTGLLLIVPAADPKDVRGRTPLSWAAEHGHEAVVKLLVKRADVEADSKDGGGLTPLSWAAVNGHKAVVKLLAEKGADVNSQNKNGATPLWRAAWGGHEAVVQLLLKKGADVDSKNEVGWTLLLRSVGGMYERVLKKGAELESKDTDGRTPQPYAMVGRYEAVLQLLFEKERRKRAGQGTGREWWMEMFVRGEE